MGREKHLHPLAASENITFAPKDSNHFLTPITYQMHGFGRARDVYMFIRPCLMTFSVYTPTYYDVNMENAAINR